MLREAPSVQLCPPLGAVSRMARPRRKFALLVSHSAGVVTLHTRMRARLVAGVVAVQVREPSFGVAANSVVHVVPPSRESSIFTSPVTFTDVQVMVCTTPVAHASPPLGLVTVMPAAAATLSVAVMMAPGALIAVTLTLLAAPEHFLLFGVDVFVKIGRAH